jgi:hypothetical protein
MSALNPPVTQRLSDLSGYMEGFYDDQAAAVVLLSVALAGVVADSVGLTLGAILALQGRGSLVQPLERTPRVTRPGLYLTAAVQ